MLEIGGKPIVSYIIETLKSAGFKKKQICLVVGFKKEKVMEYFGDSVTYTVQKEQRGTAHAAHVGIKSLPKTIEAVLVLGGDDSAFYTKKTLLDFIKKHLEASAKLSLLSVELKNPSRVGRIVRYPDQSIAIIEKEYWTEVEEKIKEISTGMFCFDRAWFEKMYPTMPLLRKLNEYGLPTVLAIARGEGVKYQVIKLENSDEWFGINTAKELEEANKRKNI
jgi:bifunctional UDP-N-acetylglucosamine pyrophosphorylase/glucosamine-1-phosphate N-acetyltransferase